MNKIFRTVWNHHRHQIVVVNENTTSHSQATGSTETSSVETFVAKTGKRLARTLLAAAVSGCFALSAQASWITDNGGKNGTLDWTVGTAGTTTWKTLRDQGERQKFCVHGIIGARQTGASNEHEHQTQFS